MEKIIKGRRYSTETAKLVGEYWFGESKTDYHYYAEELYQKNTGEFFLYGEGGPASNYAVSTSRNLRSAGEKITPLSLGDARAWAEEHLSAKEYESIFGIVGESEEKQSVTIRLTQASAQKMKLMASEQGVALSDIIENLVQKA